MSRREDKKQKKVKACSSSTSNNTQDCGSKDTKSCGDSRKCR